MSWMDSWSRPSKHQATPAPFYLLPGGEDTPYCHSCGRVISSRRNGTGTAAAAAEGPKDGLATTKKKTTTTTTATATVVKYCSSRCRGHKPGKLDREIEGVFVKLLDGGGVEGGEDGVAGVRKGSGGKKERKSVKGGRKRTKGDARVLVSCDEVERYMFSLDESESPSGSGSRSGSEDEDGQRTNGSDRRDAEAKHSQVTSVSHLHDATTDSQHHHHHHHRAPQDKTDTLEDLLGPANPLPPPQPPAVIDYDVLARLSVRSGTRIRPPQSVSEVNGSVGGEKGRAERADETGEMLERRREGLRRARRREMVRCAARRGVVFGFEGEGDGHGERRKCEAVMLGKVVEPSFAKGDWSVRWRE